MHESAFQDALITEAVQLVEETGPLDDAQAMREVLALQDDAAGRVIGRARILGRRIGLQDDLARARAGAPWVLLALVAVICLTSLALAGNVVGGSERSINVVVALASLLGLHLVTLVLWLIGLVLPIGSFNASFGWLWLSLTARVAGGKRGQTPLLLRAATRLLSRARLLPWTLGLVSHAIWTLSFAVVVAALLFALAFRNYTLNWETTILEPGFFVQAVRWLGTVPGWLGFPVPDAQAVLAPTAASASQRVWALWLTGCIVAYGLLPRVVFAIVCAGVWQARKAALQPDLAQPGFRRLLARFDAMAPRRIVDPDPGAMPHGGTARRAAGDTTDTLVAVGFELPDELAWPPRALTAACIEAMRVDGSAAARRTLLDTLTRIRPRRVLVGCSARSSPDRGTERFLREVMAQSGECRLWLVGSHTGDNLNDSDGFSDSDSDGDNDSDGDEAALRRWSAWLSDAGLDAIPACTTAEAALRGWH